VAATEAELATKAAATLNSAEAAAEALDTAAEAAALEATESAELTTAEAALAELTAEATLAELAAEAALAELTAEATLAELTPSETTTPKPAPAEAALAELTPSETTTPKPASAEAASAEAAPASAEAAPASAEALEAAEAAAGEGRPELERARAVLGCIILSLGEGREEEHPAERREQRKGFRQHAQTTRHGDLEGERHRMGLVRSGQIPSGPAPARPDWSAPGSGCLLPFDLERRTRTPLPRPPTYFKAWRPCRMRGAATRPLFEQVGSFATASCG
jgi:hypothetical protein